MSDAGNLAVKAHGLTKTYGSGSAQVSALTDVTFEILRASSSSCSGRAVRARPRF